MASLEGWAAEALVLDPSRLVASQPSLWHLRHYGAEHPQGDGRITPERRYAGLNIATGGPLSLSWNTTVTGWPMRTASASQPTILVSMVGPSASVT